MNDALRQPGDTYAAAREEKHRRLEDAENFKRS